MHRSIDLSLTALAPVIWGSTYIVTTELLPHGHPLGVAMLRALPAGLILLVLVKRLPNRDWYGRLFILGGLNFSVFWGLLFVAAYRLPGGVAATLGAMQPLVVLLLARVGYLWLGIAGAAFCYVLWFRGIARFGPATVTAFGWANAPVRKQHYSEPKGYISHNCPIQRLPCSHIVQKERGKR
ncbi:MAG: DMT family transporter [Marinobacter sp.]|uniref:DMT family transporter n=1 Tax=Marinobacter sp. TaxID=50741 RepID=UPI003F9D6E70